MINRKEIVANQKYNRYFANVQSDFSNESITYLEKTTIYVVHIHSINPQRIVNMKASLLLLIGSRNLLILCRNVILFFYKL